MAADPPARAGGDPSRARRLACIGLAAALAAVPLSGCLAGTPLEGLGDRLTGAGDDEYEMRPPPAGPREQPPEDTDEVDPLLEVTDQLLAPLPWDVIVEAADRSTGTGTFFEDLSKPYMRHWYAKHQWDRVGNHEREPYTYPGPGHPDYNVAGNRLDIAFDDGEGHTLAGAIFLPFRGTVEEYVEAADGEELPALVFFHGLGADKEVYYWWPQRMARQGYVVLAFDFPGHGDSEGEVDREMWNRKAETAEAALTYLLEDSPVAGIVDEDRVGTFGNSMGGITALEHQAIDPRVDAVVATAPVSELNVDFDSSETPIQIQTADHDGPIAPLPFTAPQVTYRIYQDLEGPKEFIVVGNGNHGSWINLPFVPAPTYSWDVATRYGDNWFHHWLRGDEDAREALTTPHPHLSPLHKSEYDLGDEQGTLAGVLPPDEADPPPLSGREAATVDGSPVDVRWRADLAAPSLHVEAGPPGGPSTFSLELAWTGEALRLATDGTLAGLDVGGHDLGPVDGDGPAPPGRVER